MGPFDTSIGGHYWFFKTQDLKLLVAGALLVGTFRELFSSSTPLHMTNLDAVNTFLYGLVSYQYAAYVASGTQGFPFNLWAFTNTPPVGYNDKLWVRY